MFKFHKNDYVSYEEIAKIADKNRTTIMRQVKKNKHFLKDKMKKIGRADKLSIDAVDFILKDVNKINLSEIKTEGNDFVIYEPIITSFEIIRRYTNSEVYFNIIDRELKLIEDESKRNKEIIDEFIKEIAFISKDCEDIIEVEQALHEKEIDELKNKYEKEIDELKNKYEKEIDELKNK